MWVRVPSIPKENKMNVLMVGDVHGRFGDLNKLINKKKPDIVIQVGDNAYYWLNNVAKGEIKPQGCKVYLVPGNHENWDMIHSRVGRHKLDPTEIEENIFYCSIGSSITINDKKILFIGGADSIDKIMRTNKLDWFREEEILSNKDVDFILDNHEHADIIVSHTCPTEFNMESTGRFDKYTDPTRLALSLILKRYKPYSWFFGHWHYYIKDRYDKTTWVGLNKVPDTKWWKEIVL